MRLEAGCAALGNSFIRAGGLWLGQGPNCPFLSHLSPPNLPLLDPLRAAALELKISMHSYGKASPSGACCSFYLPLCSFRCQTSFCLLDKPPCPLRPPGEGSSGAPASQLGHNAQEWPLRQSTRRAQWDNLTEIPKNGARCLGASKAVSTPRLTGKWIAFGGAGGR